MKYFKKSILAFAIVGAVLAAFVTKPRQACLGLDQYYYNGVSYVPAGTLGTDYFCANGTGVCTYFQIGNGFQPCQSGVFVSMHLKRKKR